MQDRNGRLRILTILSLPFYSFILNTLQNYGKGTAVGCAKMKLVSRKIAQRIYPAFCDQSNNKGTQHFSTSFKAFTGLSPHEWLMNSQPNRT